MSAHQVRFQLPQAHAKLDQSRQIEVRSQRRTRLLHLQPGDPRLAELVGENAGRSGDHGNVMAKAAQLQRKLAHMALRSAENIAPREHMNNLHARTSAWVFSRCSSDEGRKVSLLGPPYQVERRFQRLRHSASSAAEGACCGLMTHALLEPPSIARQFTANLAAGYPAAASSASRRDRHPAARRRILCAAICSAGAS
jgi:hypothetical protein